MKKQILRKMFRIFDNKIDSSFIKECFDESGKYQIKSYIKNIGEASCKWCPYADKPELCDKNAASA
jgi:hypothetical protein